MYFECLCGIDIHTFTTSVTSFLFLQLSYIVGVANIYCMTVCSINRNIKKKIKKNAFNYYYNLALFSFNDNNTDIILTK